MGKYDLRVIGTEDGMIEAIGKTEKGKEWSVHLKTANECTETWGILFIRVGELTDELKALRRRIRLLETDVVKPS